MTFGGKNPQNSRFHLNGLAISWADKVKYLDTYILCDAGLSELSSNIRKFYSQFNNTLSVLGRYAQEMSSSHLIK